MEEAVVTAVTHDTSEAKVTVSGVPDRPGVAARLFRALADKSINVDMIVQNTSAHGTTDISFTVPRPTSGRVETSQAHADELGASGVTADADVARVSLVGVGMKSHPGIAATMFETLANEQINIDMISTSTIRTSCIVARETTSSGPCAACTRRSPWADGTSGRRTLWLLRHAKTVTDPPLAAPTSTACSPRGRRDAAALGRLFAGTGEGLGPALKGVPRPQIALVSPAARTVATADLVLADMADPPRAPLRRRPLRGRPRGGARLVRALPDDVRAAMVVGHNPTAHSLSQGLLSPATRRASASAYGAASPPARSASYSLRRRPLGRRGGGTGQAGGPDGPALLELDPAAALRPGSAGWRRRPGRRRRTAPRPPWPAPRRRSSSSAVSATRVPDMPTGWPSAMAPPLTLTLSSSMPRSSDRGQADGGEGLVDLEEVDGVEVDAGLAGGLDDGPRRAGSAASCRARPPCRSRRSRPSGVTPELLGLGRPT